MSTDEVKPITVKKLPLLLNKNIIIKKTIKPLNRHIKLVDSLQNAVQEDVIYTSKSGDFMSGEAQNMVIVNKLNVLTRSSRTVAKCQDHTGEFFEKTSDEITKLIGQNKYDILFSSLCSVINQELKIRSINSILTVPKKTRTISCQTETSVKSVSVKKDVQDSTCQTESIETIFDDLQKNRPKKRNKRQQLAPYVVKDAPEFKKPRKVIISPDNFERFFMKQESIPKNESQNTESSLPELGKVFDEDSNNSVGKFSALSGTTLPGLYENPFNIIENVDKHTRDISMEVNKHEIKATEHYRHQNLDSPQDICHSNESLPFDMNEKLHNMPPDQRLKILLRQGLNDWKSCLMQDNNGHLPIHVAVLTNDVDLLRRQCLALKMREASVDVPADGLTPLRMSLFQENTQMTAVLLSFGADPLDTDDDDRTPFHIAAEMGTDHLQILINYCQHNARKVLQENEELWKSVYEHKSDEELSPLLLQHINKCYDSQGYTPLMLASKLGKYNNVLSLVESCRLAVNLRTPSSGNTALYLAVGAACMDATERGNKTKVVDHFRRTVEILVENGADPNIDNFTGSSVNDLLTEYNIGELSMLIANKLTSIRYFNGQLPNDVKSIDFMLFKDDSGKVNIKGVKETKTKSPPVPKTPPVAKIAVKTKSSPVILENVTVKPPSKVNNATPTPTSTVTGQSANKPVIFNTTVKVNNLISVIKQDNVNTMQTYTPIVKNFTLRKPLILKSEIKNNKRKLEIVVEPSASKKPNKSE